VELSNFLLDILLVFLVGDAVDSGTGIFPQIPECFSQRLRREKVSDREELSLPVIPGQPGYAIKFW